MIQAKPKTQQSGPKQKCRSRIAFKEVVPISLFSCPKPWKSHLRFGNFNLSKVNIREVIILILTLKRKSDLLQYTTCFSPCQEYISKKSTDFLDNHVVTMKIKAKRAR